MHYGLYSDIVYNGITGQLPSQLQNRKLTWETNKTHNIGIDFRLFDRLNGSIDWYTRRTEDMLDRSSSALYDRFCFAGPERG